MVDPNADKGSITMTSNATLCRSVELRYGQMSLKLTETLKKDGQISSDLVCNSICKDSNPSSNAETPFYKIWRYFQSIKSDARNEIFILMPSKKKSNSLVAEHA